MGTCTTVRGPSRTLRGYLPGPPGCHLHRWVPRFLPGRVHLGSPAVHTWDGYRYYPTDSGCLPVLLLGSGTPGLHSLILTFHSFIRYILPFCSFSFILFISFIGGGWKVLYMGTPCHSDTTILLHSIPPWEVPFLGTWELPAIDYHSGGISDLFTPFLCTFLMILPFDTIVDDTILFDTISPFYHFHLIPMTGPTLFLEVFIFDSTWK